MKMTPEQIKAAEFYAKVTPRQAMRRALRKYRVPLSEIRTENDTKSIDGIKDHPK